LNLGSVCAENHGLIWTAPSGVQYAAAAAVKVGVGSSCSTMTQHYPTISAAAAVWRAGHLSSFLVCLSFTHAPYYLPEH